MHSLGEIPFLHVLSRALSGLGRELWPPEDPGPSLPSHPPTLSPSPERRKKCFSRKDSNVLRVVRCRLLSCWPQPGCTPSRQLLAQVFKQCSSSSESCRPQVLPPGGRSPGWEGAVWLPAPGPLRDQESWYYEQQKPLVGPKGTELGCPSKGGNIGWAGPQDTSLTRHHPLPPALPFSQSAGWGPVRAGAGATPQLQRRICWVWLVTPSWPGGGASGHQGRFLPPAQSPSQPEAQPQI